MDEQPPLDITPQCDSAAQVDHLTFELLLALPDQPLHLGVIPFHPDRPRAPGAPRRLAPPGSPVEVIARPESCRQLTVTDGPMVAGGVRRHALGRPYADATTGLRDAISQ